MCMTCDYNPCLESCPEALGYPKALCECKYCGDSVCEREAVRKIKSGIYIFHEECLSEMRADELMDLLDISTEIMQ